MKLDKFVGCTVALSFAIVASAQDDLPLATSTVQTTPVFSSSEIAIVGRVVYPGWLTLGGGGSYYDDLIFEVLTTIKGSAPLWTPPPKPASAGPDGAADWELIKLPPAVHGKSVALTKWRLNGPEKYSASNQRESPPLIGQDYIIAGSMKNGTLLVGKLLLATSEHLEHVRTILGLTSIDTSRLQHGQVPSAVPTLAVPETTIRNQRVWPWVAVAVILGAVFWRAFKRRGRIVKN